MYFLRSELTKESVVNLLQLNAIEAAVQLMVEDFTVFRSIGELGGRRCSLSPLVFTPFTTTY